MRARALMVEHDGRDGDTGVVEEGDYLRPVGEVAVEGVLRLVVVEVQLRLLVAVVMVLRVGRLPEPEHAHPVAHSHGDHDGLHPRRVVEHGRVARAAPLLGRAPRLGDEAAERVVLDDARAEDVEAWIGDGDGCGVEGAGGGVAGGDVEEVRGLADVEQDGDAVAVGVAEAVGTAGAEMEDVAVDEGEVGLGADVGGEAGDAGVVEAEDGGVGVDEGAVAGAEEDAAVAHDGAGGDAAGEGEEGREIAEDAGVVPAEAVPGAERAAEGWVEVELLARERVEEGVVVVIRVVAAPVDGELVVAEVKVEPVAPEAPRAGARGRRREAALEEVVHVAAQRRLRWIGRGKAEERGVEARGIKRRQRREHGSRAHRPAQHGGERGRGAQHDEEEHRERAPQRPLHRRRRRRSIRRRGLSGSGPPHGGRRIRERDTGRVVFRSVPCELSSECRAVWGDEFFIGRDAFRFARWY